MGSISSIGTLFANPYPRPLSTSAQFQQCYLLFFYAGTGTIATVYRDAGLTWPYNQLSIPGSGVNSVYAPSIITASGIPSDAVGRFDPIYLNPNLNYFYQLYSAAGVLLETNYTSTQYGSTYQRLAAVKYGATSRCNTTTLVNDPALQINIPAPAATNTITTYRIEADLAFLSESGTQTIAFQIAYSGAIYSSSGLVPALVVYGIAGNSSLQSGIGLNAIGNFAANANQAQNGLHIVGNVQFGSAYTNVLNLGGTLSIQWAQNAASTTPLVLNAGSALYATLL
jgi:hypothetical protein